MQNDLAKVAEQWEAHGRTDPRWAVLSENGKRGGGWDDASFYATGRTLVADTLAFVRSVGAYPAEQERALDFGCGVGRLSVALAGHFRRVDGVDVAPSMIAHAEASNPDRDRIAYHANIRGDLGLFPTDSFNLVFSFITLQHIPTHLALSYVREFVRVAALGGTIVFQAPHRTDHPGWKHYVDAAFPRLSVSYRKVRYGTATQNDVYVHDAAEVVEALSDAGAAVQRVQAGRADDCRGWLSALYVAQKRA
jgi:SAM-dependent methyltransferase